MLFADPAFSIGIGGFDQMSAPTMTHKLAAEAVGTFGWSSAAAAPRFLPPIRPNPLLFGTAPEPDRD